MRLATHESHDVGEHMAVTLAIPGEEPITLTGIVRWSQSIGRRYAAGLGWGPLDDATVYRLDRLLRRQARPLPPLQREREGSGARLSDSKPPRAVRPAVAGAVGIVAVLVITRMALLQFENAKLSRAIHVRNLVISQLEVRGERFERELESATEELQTTLGDVEQLDQETSRFQDAMQKLSRDVQQFESAYLKAREERGQLFQRVTQLERERQELLERIASIPMVRQAIDDAIKSRTSAPPHAPLHDTIRE